MDHWEQPTEAHMKAHKYLCQMHAVHTTQGDLPLPFLSNWPILFRLRCLVFFFAGSFTPHGDIPL